MQYILHVDMNKFYATVEQMLDPSLKRKPIAVCGCTEERHGIVLTASAEAKAMGVKTGMANWQARQACAGLIVVQPHYDQYLKYSGLARAIYRRYTDTIEPFGMDENWLDISPLCGNFADAAHFADEIRLAVREELGLTVSVGVSFSKIFAKLGSDMKKPDAVTVLDDISWRERVWSLPVSDLLYVGPATTRRLMMYSIHTIGDLARVDPVMMDRWFGKNGLVLWNFANGLDHSRVMPSGMTYPIKSIGHGITCSRDLESPEEARLVLTELSQEVGRRLRASDLAARGVQVSVRTSQLSGSQFQCRLLHPTCSALELSRAGTELFIRRYCWDDPVRSLCIRAIDLIPGMTPCQLDIFGDEDRRARRKQLDTCIDDIQNRFGKKAVYPAVLLKKDLPIPNDGRELVIMPDRMFR